jgi:hypothetical protein
MNTVMDIWVHKTEQDIIPQDGVISMKLLICCLVWYEVGFTNYNKLFKQNSLLMQPA